MSDEAAANEPLVLHSLERRVLGVLIEKGLTTPEYYPLTLKAVITGCNQKQNRHPTMQLSEEQVEDTLEALAKKELAKCVMGTTGRVPRWRQELGIRFQFRAIQLAVIGELLLRGPQAEGELRSRASRMREIPDLDTLRTMLSELEQHSPPFALRLSPPGQQRGVRHTHAFHRAEELDQLREEAASGAPAPTSSPSPAPPRAAATPDVLERLAELERRVAQLEARLGDE